MATAFICLFSATCGVCCAIIIVFVAVLLWPELKPDAAGPSLGDFVRRRHTLPGSRVAFSPVTVGALHGRRKALTSQFCPQYNTQVEFLMETSLETGRTLLHAMRSVGRTIIRWSTAGAEERP
jgi:hypothetical protein